MNCREDWFSDDDLTDAFLLESDAEEPSSDHQQRLRDRIRRESLQRFGTITRPLPQELHAHAGTLR